MRDKAKTVARIALLGMLAIALLLAGCVGIAGSPALEDMYTRNVLPAINNTYTIGSDTLLYLHGYFTGLSSSTILLSGAPPITLDGAGLVWIEFRPDLDFESVRAHGVPTWVERGVFGGFSLPIFAADDEQLNYDMCVPGRWDGASDIYAHIFCYVDTAQDAADDAFTLNVDYEHFTAGTDIVPNTSTAISIETTTGVCAQFQSFLVEFQIPYAGIVADDILGHRLTRIATLTGNEIDGEVIIDHAGLIFRVDKLGIAAP